MQIRRTFRGALLALLAACAPGYATVIVSTETPASPVLIDDMGPLVYDFAFTFPGLAGGTITQLSLQFTFDDDEEGNCPTECESFAIFFTDAIPAGNTILSGGVSNWALGGANPFTITGVNLIPTDSLEDGTPASAMFGYMTDGSDNLLISVRSTSGDFRFRTATATVTFDEPVTPPPPDGEVPEPATILLLGAGLVSFGWMGRKRVRPGRA